MFASQTIYAQQQIKREIRLFLFASSCLTSMSCLITKSKIYWRLLIECKKNIDFLLYLNNGACQCTLYLSKIMNATFYHLYLTSTTSCFSKTELNRFRIKDQSLALCILKILHSEQESHSNVSAFHPISSRI